MSHASSAVYKFGPFILDEAEHQLLNNGDGVPLTPKVFDLLLLLVKNSGHLIEKADLLNHLWPESFVEETNLNRNISVLRKILGSDEYIETVPKRGYRFFATVERSDARPPAALGQVGTGPAAARASLAILPFRSLSADLADEYLGTGIADGLIARLSNLSGVVVRPTSAILQYANRTVDAAAAGTELRVASVLEGSIRKSGERIRVRVQLVSVRDGASIWASTFEENLSDIFAVEDSICEKVASAFKPVISERERNRLVKHYTDNMVAYRAYLKGRHYSFKMTADGLRKAIVSFNHAIEIDPNYALAYAGLADAFTTASEWQLPPKEAMSKAGAAAARAIELDNDLAEAHASLAHVKIHTLDPSAEQQFQTAIALNPNYPGSYLWYAEYLCMQARLEEAIASVKRALDLDPLSPMASFFLSFPLYLAKRYEEAASHLRDVIEVNPYFWYAHWSLGGQYLMMGLIPEALAEYEKARGIDATPLVMASIACAHAIGGNRGQALKVVKELDELSRERYISPYDLAKIQLSLGDTDKAIELLEKAFDDQSEFAIFMKVDPSLDSLRDVPRFNALLDRVRAAEDVGAWRGN
jgi:TolB-like protein/cytochrome c-type biogenesis protein CcmH/NrfG